MLCLYLFAFDLVKTTSLTLATKFTATKSSACFWPSKKYRSLIGNSYLPTIISVTWFRYFPMAWLHILQFSLKYPFKINEIRAFLVWLVKTASYCQLDASILHCFWFYSLAWRKNCSASSAALIFGSTFVRSKTLSALTFSGAVGLEEMLNTAICVIRQLVTYDPHVVDPLKQRLSRG